MDRESELDALSRALASAKKEALIRETERNGLQELWMIRKNGGGRRKKSGTF